MFFADFTKLKIHTDYNFITKNMLLDVHRDTPISAIKAAVEKELQENIEKTGLPVLYNFQIKRYDDDFPEYNNDEFEFEEKLQPVLDYLLTVANIAIPVTLQVLETGNSLARERRLDVPVKLKPLHASYGSLKRACNLELKTPILNIKITYGGLFFLLCDGRKLDAQGDSSDE